MPIAFRMLVALVAMVWGLNFVVIRWGLDGVDPATMTALRFLFTAVPLIFFVRRPTVPVSVVALYGVLFGGGLWGLVNLAIAHGTPAGFASLLLQSSAFMSVLVALVLFKENVSRLKLLGTASAFAGFLTIVLFRSDAVPLTGVALVFTAAVFWTVCNSMIRIYKPGDVVSFIVWSSLFVPVPVLAFGWVEHVRAGGGIVPALSELTLPTLNGWLSILFQSYVTTLLGYGIWTRAIARHGLANVAPLSLLVPLSGLACGWWVYDESLGAVEMLGATLVLGGLVALSWRDTVRV